MIFKKVYGNSLIGNEYYLDSLDDLKDKKEEVVNTLNNIQYILNNYDNITPFDFYNHFKNFIKVSYDIEYYSEPIDEAKLVQEFNENELTLVNLMYNENFKNVIKIKTSMVYNNYYVEGHGKDLSYGYKNYQVFLFVATKKELEKEKVYSSEEIENMINSEDIFIIDIDMFKIGNIDNISFKKEKYIKIENIKKETMSYENALGIMLKDKFTKQDLFNYFKEYLDAVIKELDYFQAGFYDYHLITGEYIATNYCFEEAGYNRVYELYKDKFKRKNNWK